MINDDVHYVRFLPILFNHDGHLPLLFFRERKASYVCTVSQPSSRLAGEREHERA